jgi:thiol-disulfide isomerase/thioredoxin
MRKLLALAALVGFMTASAAQDTKPKQPEKKEPTLKVGDKAPALVATKWLQGAEVKGFAAGKVYVVEFWATWCGPCIVMMPHMGELQREYKDRGVTFIGFSAKDPNNSQEKVSAMVEKRGPKLGYTFAYGDDRETYNAWMRAAGQNGIPCCFVVDKHGKIAYIGHPMYLDEVLPKVVAGKWTEADNEGLKDIEKEVTAVFRATGNKDPEVFLKELAGFEKKHPKLAGIPYFNGPRIGSLVKAKKTDEAKKLSEQLIAKGEKTGDDRLLSSVSMSLRGPDAKENKELLALSVKAAEASVKVAGDKDPIALYYLAEAYFAAGDKAKAKATGEKAVAAADGNLKKQIENLTKKYDDKKDEKKD